METKVLARLKKTIAGAIVLAAVMMPMCASAEEMPPQEEPVIEVNDTSVTGLALSHTRKAKGRIIDIITVMNAGGRNIKLQTLTNRKTWVTVKTFKTKMEEKQKVQITFTSRWWKKSKSSWRIKIKGNKEYSEYVSPVIKVITRRYYQNPKGYYQLGNGDVTVDGGGYTLKCGYMGFKVQKVNSYFGIGDYNWPRYTSRTKDCVKSFQRKHGLKVTGNVNKKTWMKLNVIKLRT